MVKPGDTLIRIGLDSGQNWRDIARWNGIQNPNLIEVGQVLRVLPPSQDPSAAVSRPVQAAGRLESRPLEARAAEATTAGGSGGSGIVIIRYAIAYPRTMAPPATD